ncbi:DUF6766 family protein [Pollutibacter soli]|uniref:DUF6766 family protein n=1 Tax=Pollutibacter soli TaxID=3034157 RepID=UPI0030141690
MKKYIRNNGLSIVFIALFILSLGGQILTGFNHNNDELEEENKAPLSMGAYLQSGHFIQATFENWESEFLQMGLFVLLTISLRQKGSSESKSCDEPEEVDREPDPKKKDAPWPVKRGGLILKLYKNSLSIAFFFLFILSFALHLYGSLKDENEKRAAKELAAVTFHQYLGKSRFWFESFQNWQSEFLSVFAIVIFSIFLRQKGSPQSKPVDAPDDETGE